MRSGARDWLLSDEPSAPFGGRLASLTALLESTEASALARGRAQGLKDAIDAAEEIDQQNEECTVGPIHVAPALRALAQEGRP